MQTWRSRLLSLWLCCASCHSAQRQAGQLTILNVRSRRPGLASTPLQCQMGTRISAHPQFCWPIETDSDSDSGHYRDLTTKLPLLTWSTRGITFEVTGPDGGVVTTYVGGTTYTITVCNPSCFGHSYVHARSPLQKDVCADCHVLA